MREASTAAVPTAVLAPVKRLVYELEAMSEERLASALERARIAARRIEEALLALPDSRPTTTETERDRSANDAAHAALRTAVTPILAELDAMIAKADAHGSPEMIESHITGDREQAEGH